ncbi:MAG: D-alanyl-D-alanine carboxypeptidase family protein [Candidatus Paceibacterota bacterium]
MSFKINLNKNSQKEIAFFIVFGALLVFIFSFSSLSNRYLKGESLNENITSFEEDLKNVKALSFLVGDLENQKVILEKNKNLHLYPASISKLVLAMVVIDELPLEKEIYISSYALSAEGEEGGLKEGEAFKVIDLLKVLLISSSNDAALAFEEEFRNQGKDIIDLMNRKVQQIGLEQTAIFDPRGIDRKGNFSTASDLFLLAKEIYYHYPLIGEITRKEKEVVFSLDGVEHQLVNTNLLTGKIKELWGGKTGTTPEAGDCLLTFYEIFKEGSGQKIPIVIIVLSSSQRFEDTQILYDYFKNYYLKNL